MDSTTPTTSTNAPQPKAPTENRSTRRARERAQAKLVAQQEKAGTRPRRMLVTCSGTYGAQCGNTSLISFAATANADSLQRALMPTGWRLCIVGVNATPEGTLQTAQNMKPETVFTLACPSCVEKLMAPPLTVPAVEIQATDALVAADENKAP